MVKSISRVLFIAVILFALVGQAIAFNTPMFIETSVDSLSPSFSKLVKQLDSNRIDTDIHIDSEEDCCVIDCCAEFCDAGCTCIANACSSFFYVNTQVDSFKIAAVKESVYIQPFKQPNSIASLLYRPPIFSS
jgi:hypothetical protein